MDFPKRLGLLMQIYFCDVRSTELVYSKRPVLSTYISESTASVYLITSGFR